MKKILVIMILAITFIPISQTGASMRDKDVRYNSQAKESHIMANMVQDNTLKDVLKTAPNKVKRDEKAKKCTLNRQKPIKKRISSERKDRLVGLLILAYGGQK